MKVSALKENEMYIVLEAFRTFTHNEILRVTFVERQASGEAIVSFTGNNGVTSFMVDYDETLPLQEI